MCLCMLPKGTKGTKCCWCSLNFVFCQLVFLQTSYILLPHLNVYICITLLNQYVQQLLLFLKAQSFQHSGIVNFCKQFVCNFPSWKLESGFDVQLYTVPMQCCGSSNTKTVLNAMVKFAVPFLCQCIPLISSYHS